MKAVLLSGKISVFIFWIAVLINIGMPLPAPYDMILNVIGALSLIAHIIESIMCRKYLSQHKNGGLELLQILAFGAFHMWWIKHVRKEGIVK